MYINMKMNIERKKAMTIIGIVMFALTLIIIFCTSGVTRVAYRLVYKKEYSEYVEKYSKKYNVDENLVYAVMKVESNFNVNAESGKGAVGLMQLMQTTAKDIVKQTDIKMENRNIKEVLLDPESNINIGAKYLSILLKKYKNVELAITAYNAGIGTVDNWVEKGILKDDGSDVVYIPYLETNTYVRRILRDYKIYENIY